jgi:transcriptional regulator with XRE-family HTH domain
MKKLQENSIGARIRYSRENARLGQQEIADGIGVSI